MSLAAELCRRAGPLLEAQRRHPFVRGIGDGSLPPDVFARWVRQDWLYLVEYARALALAAARADGLEAMRWYARTLELTLGTEMELHRRYAARFGIAPAELEAAPLLPTTRAYADFLLRTAALGDAAEVAAALLPCAWGYVELALEMKARGPSPEPRYQEWIEQYASPEFQEAARWLAAELDRLAAGASPAARERLAGTFLAAMRHELAFWEACWRGEEADSAASPRL